MGAQATRAEDPADTKGESSLPSKEALAEKVIRGNVLWASGGGLIPVPVLDVVAITAVEVKMLKELSELYQVPFKEDQVKGILFAMAAGLGAPTIGTAITISLFKAVPLAGLFSAFVAVPGLAAAFTYAIGKVFLQHFASGGTFLDFKPQNVRDYFARQFEEGKLVAARMKVEGQEERKSK